MAPNVSETFLRAGVDHVVNVLFLPSRSNVFTVKMIDRIEFQAFGAVSGHEVDGSAGGFEDVTGVRDSGAQGPTMASEYSHALGGI